MSVNVAVRFVVRSVVVALTSVGGAAAAADQTLADAAKRAEWDMVRTLVEQGTDVNGPQGDGATALHWASYWDDADGAALLIRAGADVNAANDLGVTPLWTACENGSAAMAFRLLDAGANPNLSLPSGETSLMTAARTGSADVVRYLLDAGAAVDATAGRGQTALMWAVAQQHADVVRALLEGGADVAAKSDVWTEVVKTSPEPWNPEYIADLPQGGYTALLFAARVGDLDATKLLVAAGADVNDAAPYGTSATVVAAHSGHGDVARFLLSRGADPNAADAGYTALHAAILHKDATLVGALVDRGADVNAEVLSSTPVRRDSVDFYLHPSYVGATPFWLAARFNAPEIMRLLAQRGAETRFVHHPTYWEGTLAANKNRSQVNEGATTALMAAVGLGGRDPLVSVNRLDRIAESAPVRSTRREPNPVELEAVSLAAVKIATEFGVDVDVANADGDTALHAVAARGHDSIVDYLVAHGARLDVTNRSGETPLALARRGRGRGPNTSPHQSTVELLRRLGARE